MVSVLRKLRPPPVCAACKLKRHVSYLTDSPCTCSCHRRKSAGRCGPFKLALRTIQTAQEALFESSIRGANRGTYFSHVSMYVTARMLAWAWLRMFMMVEKRPRLFLIGTVTLHGCTSLVTSSAILMIVFSTAIHVCDRHHTAFGGYPRLYSILLSMFTRMCLCSVWIQHAGNQHPAVHAWLVISTAIHIFNWFGFFQTYHAFPWRDSPPCALGCAAVGS